MTETTTPAAPEAAPKKGRGPTRPEVRFADLCGVAAKLDDAEKVNFVAAVEGAVKPGELRGVAKTNRAQLREYVKQREAEIAAMERRADLVEEAERLPDHLRRALLATLRAEVTP